jgi:hypothetical protein
MPVDQFSLDARADEFLALVVFPPGDCDFVDDYALRYVSIETALFSTRPPRLSPDDYLPVPRPSGDGVENRFTEDYLVLGGAQGRWGAFGNWYDYAASEIVVIPVKNPTAQRTLALGHSAERIEVFGRNAIVDGYRGNSGLSVSTLDLGRTPAVVDTVYLERVIETEGRSHAFNARLEADGSGVFGLPTTFKTLSWRDYDEVSNVHFFAVDAGLDIRPSGYLAADPDAVDDDYECEVSCVDWYGNARPIFTQGRVFALMATELVEGRLDAGGITELQRVGMTGTPRHRR